MELGAVLQRYWSELGPLLQEQGYDLVEVELAHQGSAPLLRIFVDKIDGGITLDDCTKVARMLDPVLDAMEALPEQYFLEVSSPGIARPLRKAADFARFAGEAVKVVTQGPVEGRKKFAGVLKGIQDGMIAVECDGKEYRIHLENLKKAHLNR